MTHALFAGRPSNILEWHFVISGPKDSPYEGGQYHGKLVFPSEYPYKPPAIMMLTPNGRAHMHQDICYSFRYLLEASITFDDRYDR